MESKIRLFRILTLLISLSILWNSSSVKGLTFSADQYVGCFAGNSTRIGQPDTGYRNSSLTIEMCIEICRKGRNTYSRLENGTICSCVDTYDVQISDSACDEHCTGSSSQYCGSNTTQSRNMSISIYSLYTVCPSGYFGAACDNFCHCKRQFPCDRATGKCPNGCDGNFTGTSCSSTLLDVSLQYVGCYKDIQEDRALIQYEDRFYERDQTAERCIGVCLNQNNSYAGTQFSSQCFCGENFGKHGKLNETQCSSTCNGNPKQNCGGADINSVYSVCPTGYFDRNCSRRCNCVNESRCTFQNGTCPLSQCEPGWKGSSCNIRDCLVENGGCQGNESCSVVDLIYSNVSVCRCSEGFQRIKIWENCTDIDECSDIESPCEQSGANCSNTIGGYYCSCTTGESTYKRPCSPVTTGSEPASSGRSTQFNNVSTIVGAVVGSIGGLLVILLIVGIVVIYRRRSRKQKDSESHPGSTNVVSNNLPTDELYSVPIKTAPKKLSIKDLVRMNEDSVSAAVRYEREFKSVATDSQAPCTVGKRREVKKKNRFKNIVPYDHCRVVLPEVNNSPYSDYINASFIKGYYETEKIIATQGPRRETLEDFWRMVWEYRVNCIVMVTQLVEGGKEKCEQYWPDLLKKVTYGSLSVKTTNEDFHSEFVLRHLQVSKDSETLDVTHWQLLSWGDSKVPNDVKGFLSFRRKIRQSLSPDGCLVVHCSAGVGRTGTFIAIDYLIEEGRSEGAVCMLSCLQKLRQQRTQMVQTQQQYEFIYSALVAEFTLGDTIIPQSDFEASYENLMQKKSESGKTRLETQFKMLQESSQQIMGYEAENRVISKTVSNSKTSQLDAVRVQGWKKPGAYISMKHPTSDTVPDMWTICFECSCSTIIFFEKSQMNGYEIGNAVSFVPTANNSLRVGPLQICLQNTTEMEFGSCYGIHQRVEATYENKAIYENVNGINQDTNVRVFQVTKYLESEWMEFEGLLALYNAISTQGNAKPVAIISDKSDHALTSFCMAAFNSFNMIKEQQEVDVYQIVQDVRKSKSTFTPSLEGYVELHKVINQFIQSLMQEES